jgi:hypothetical protein
MIFDDYDWSKILQPAAEGAAASIVPAYVASVGAKKAAAANQRAVDIANAGAANATASTIAGSDAARTTLQPVVNRGQTGAQYLTGVVARNPYQLTPEQESDLAFQKEQMINGMDSSLRGSGQGYTAAVSRFENNARLPLIQSNVARSDQAAGTLNSEGVNATNQQANLQAGTGTRVGQIQQQAADTGANATVATGKVQAGTLGDIGSFFAKAQNDANRPSRYGKFAAGG